MSIQPDTPASQWQKIIGLLDWAESILCNTQPLPHWTEAEHFEVLKKWRDQKHELFPFGQFTPQPTAPTTQPERKERIRCPHCGSPILWSEDRGAHCDGCDDFNPEKDLPEQPTAARTPFIDIENRPDFRGNVIDATGTSIPAWLLEAVHDLRDMEIGSRFYTDRTMSAMEDERWALFINGYMPKKPCSLPDAKEAQ